jgi:hypothetical protein
VKTAVICHLSDIGCRLSTFGFRLSAIRYPLTAGHSHSERGEESRYVSLVILMLVNTSRREDVGLSDIRYQTSENGISESKRGRCLSAPGFKAPPGLLPQSGLVQRGGKRFLRLTGLSPRGFSGLTGPLGPRVVVGALLGASTMLPPTGGIYTHRPKGDTLTLSR